jgi:hypothetical protein
MENAMNDLTQAQIAINVGSTHTGNRGRSTESSWFEAMAQAWGEALDNQANRITDAAARLEDGVDSPSQITLVTAESLRMQFLSNSSHTALTSMGSALETMARKQ